MDDFEFALEDFDLDELPVAYAPLPNGTCSDSVVSSLSDCSGSGVRLNKCSGRVTSASSRTGSRHSSKTEKRGKQSTDAAVVVKHNMSRKTRCNVLYAFPCFDKCDSLLFFPTTMTKHLNSGDMEGLLKLVTTHLDRNCQISMEHAPIKFDTKTFVDFFEVLGDQQPDRIMCIHTTKVVENEIYATLYMKFTDCKALSAGVLRTVTHEGIRDVLGGERSESLKEKMRLGEKSVEEQASLLSLVETERDLTIYVRGLIRLTVDDITKKITKLHMSGELTSVQLSD